MARSRKQLIHIPRFDEEPDFVLNYSEYDDKLVDAIIEARDVRERQETGGYFDRRRMNRVA